MCTRLCKWILCVSIWILVLPPINHAQQDLAGVDARARDSTTALGLKYAGIEYYLEGKIDSAIFATKRSLGLWQQISQDSMQANMYQNLGSFYRDMGRRDSSIYFYQQVFNHIDPMHTYGLTAYEFIGLNYEKLNNLVKSRAYYLEGSEMALQAKDTSKYLHLLDFYTRTFMDYDISFALKNFQKTQETFAYYATRYPTEPVMHDYSVNLHNQGVLYESLGEPQKALELSRQSFRILEQYYLAKKQEGNISPNLEWDYRKTTFLIPNNYANFYCELGELGKAKREHEKAAKSLARIRQVYPDSFSTYYVDHLLTAAHIQKAYNRYEHMDSLFSDAFDALIPAYRKGRSDFYPSPEDLPAARDKEDLLNCMRQWIGYWERSHLTTNEIYKRVKPMYQLADQLIDLILETQDSRRAVQFWRSEIVNVYQAAFDLAAAQGDIDYAFYLSEKSKAVALLTETIASRVYNSLDSLSKEKLDCKWIIDSLELEFKNAALGDSLKKQIKAALIAAERYCNPVFFKESKGIYRDLGDYILSAQDVQVRIEADQLVIEYFDGRQDQYGFLITKDTVLLLRLADITARNPLIRKLSDEIYRVGSSFVNNLDETNETLSMLYDHLLRPFESGFHCPRLVIVPTGSLFKVPFSALVRKAGSDKAQYLVETHSIQTVYSLSFLFENDHAKVDHNLKNAVLGMAPAFEIGRSLAPLVFSEEEISGIYGSVRSHKTLGEAATKEHFLQRAPRYNCIALSTHGKANNEDGMQSFVAFGSDSTEWLYAGEIYSKKIPAELLTLSACETAVGNYEAGEGVISMAYAFRQAGVQSLVTTLWSVNDRTSAELMVSFYKELAKGVSKDQALAHAQRNYLQEAKKEVIHPFFWAGFTLIGDASPIDLPRAGLAGLWWKLALAAVVALILFILLRRSR